MRAWIIILTVFLVGLIATLAYIVIQKPGKKGRQQDNGTSGSGGSASGSGAGGSMDPQPGGSTDTAKSVQSENTDLFTVSVADEKKPGTYDVYSFDCDMNHFKPGDLIWSRTDTTLFDDMDQPVPINGMVPLGTAVRRTVAGLFIENNGNLYFFPGLNEDKEICKQVA